MCEMMVVLERPRDWTKRTQSLSWAALVSLIRRASSARC